MSRVRLPDWQAFATRRKNLDPVRAFLDFVAHELGGIREGHVIDPNRLFLVDDDDSRLTELQRSWYRWLTARPKDAWVDLLQLRVVAGRKEQCTCEIRRPVPSRRQLRPGG